MVGIKNKNFLLECGKYVENNFDVWKMWIIYFPQAVRKFVENKNAIDRKMRFFHQCKAFLPVDILWEAPGKRRKHDKVHLRADGKPV